MWSEKWTQSFPPGLRKDSPTGCPKGSQGKNQLVFSLTPWGACWSILAVPFCLHPHRPSGSWRAAAVTCTTWWIQSWCSGHRRGTMEFRRLIQIPSCHASLPFLSSCFSQCELLISVPWTSSRREETLATLSPQLTPEGLQASPVPTRHQLPSAASTPLFLYTLQKLAFRLLCSKYYSFKYLSSKVHHAIPLLTSCHHMKQ